MGKVWLDSTEIGVFNPQTEGTSGNILLDAANIGTFSLIATGYVYLNGTQVGTYWAIGGPPPPPSDPRSQTKIYLDTYIDDSNLTKDDNATPVSYAIMYANPDYPLKREFKASENPVDLLYLIGKPTSELKVGVRYTEHVPIIICTVNKPGITGTKLAWKAESELRRICETHPHGSLRTVERISDSEERLGSTVLYATTFMLNYRRTA